MKKLLLFLVLLALAAFAGAQELVDGSIRSSASSCQPQAVTSACVFLQVGPQTNYADITVRGTYSGTLQFEVSGDAGATWVSVNATPPNSSTAVTSTTSTGTWTASMAGHTFLRVRASAFASGVANVTLNPSQAVTAGTGGGGGSMTYPGAGIACSTGSAWCTSYTSFGSEAGVATSADPGTTAEVPMVADGTHGQKPSASGALGTGAFAAVLPYSAGKLLGDTGSANGGVTVGAGISLTGGVLSNTFSTGSSQCQVFSTANSFCLTLPPYYASPEGATATTTTGTFGVGTSGAIGSCSTFVANEGVYIAGAGTSGANYIGTVSSCVGTTLTITPTTATSVSGAVVQHDETAAFLAAFTALNPGGGTIYLPGSATGSSGLYLVNGPLLDTGGANAVLPLPKLPNYVGNPTTITIKGFIIPYAAPIIQTSQNTSPCNFIGGYDSAAGDGFAGFTNVILHLEDLQILLPSNPYCAAVNATYLLGLVNRNVLVLTTDYSSVPTHSGGAGVLYPKVSNNIHLAADDLAVAGFYTDVRLGEHAQVNSLYLVGSHNALVLDASGGLSGDPYANFTNGISVNYVWCGPAESVVNCVAGGAAATTVNVMMMDIETISGYAVSDPSNFLKGTLGLNMPGWNCASPTLASMISGGAKLQVKPLQCLGGLLGSLALATSSISSGACQAVTPGSVNSVASPVVATTDVIQWAPSGSLSGATGFAPATSGGLSIAAYPTAGYVNFDVCNWSASPITPSAVTVNWKVPK